MLRLPSSPGAYNRRLSELGAIIDAISCWRCVEKMVRCLDPFIGSQTNGLHNILFDHPGCEIETADSPPSRIGIDCFPPKPTYALLNSGALIRHLFH